MLLALASASRQTLNFGTVNMGVAAPLAVKPIFSLLQSAIVLPTSGGKNMPRDRAGAEHVKLAT